MSGPAYPWLANNTWGLARFNLDTQAGTGHAQLEMAYGSHGATPEAINDAETWFTIYAANLLPYQSNTYSLTSVEVVLNVDSVITEGISTHAAEAGGQSPEPMPPQCSVILSKQTGLIGRHYRGRMYIPGAPYSDLATVDTGLLTPTAWATWIAQAAAFYAAAAAAQLQPALISRKEWNNPDPGYQFITVSSMYAEQRTGSQRRRNRKAAHR
jgi:hypothetical protein